MSSLKIGSVTLPHGLMLAPMAGVTDTAFRLLCRQFGAEYAVTEMVSAKALCFEQKQRAGKPLRFNYSKSWSAIGTGIKSVFIPSVIGIPNLVKAFVTNCNVRGNHTHS